MDHTNFIKISRKKVRNKPKNWTCVTIFILLPIGEAQTHLRRGEVNNNQLSCASGSEYQRIDVLECFGLMQIPSTEIIDNAGGRRFSGKFRCWNTKYIIVTSIVSSWTDGRVCRRRWHTSQGTTNNAYQTCQNSQASRSKCWHFHLNNIILADRNFSKYKSEAGNKIVFRVKKRSEYYLFWISVTAFYISSFAFGRWKAKELKRREPIHDRIMHDACQHTRPAAWRWNFGLHRNLFRTP